MESKSAPSSRLTRPGPAHAHQAVRAKLERLVSDLVQKTLEPCRKALADAGLKPSDIDEVLLVGGMTHALWSEDCGRHSWQGTQPFRELMKWSPWAPPFRAVSSPAT